MSADADITLVLSALSSLRTSNLTDAEAQLVAYLEESGFIVLPDGTEIQGRVQRDENGKAIREMATCGACGFQWNDAFISGVTPTPAARCPNEYGHGALRWETADTDEPGDQNASSQVVRGWWAIGRDDSSGGWSVELIEVDESGDEIQDGGVVMVNQPDEQSAKAVAQNYEDGHR